MDWILAVDGGGSTTDFVLSDREANVVSRYNTGSTNYKSVGQQVAVANLIEGRENVLKPLNLSIDQVKHCVFGMSGCDTQEDYQIVKDLLREAGFPDSNMTVVNDAVLAYYAQAEAPGVVIISGTGSIVMSIDRKNRTLRKGGWGYNISDIGSGYWLGCEAIKIGLLYAENIVSESGMIRELMETLRVRDKEELLRKLVTIDSPSEIALLSNVVCNAAENKDEMAIAIIAEGTQILALQAKQCITEHLRREKAVNIVLSGGVFSSDYYRNAFIEILEKEVVDINMYFHQQINNPSQGGIALALKELKSNEK